MHLLLDFSPPYIVYLAMLDSPEQPFHLSQFGGKLITLTGPNALNLFYNQHGITINIETANLIRSTPF